MAITFIKQAIAVKRDDNSFLSFAKETELEGITETYVADAPVVLTAGFIVEAANPATVVHGFALRAGQNGAAAGDKVAEFLTAYPGITIYGNALDGTDPVAVTEVLADADIGATMRLARAAILPASANGWYFSDTASSHAVMIMNRKSDYTIPNSAQLRALNGDIDARLSATLLDAARQFES